MRQYANGIYVPDIYGVRGHDADPDSFPKPQTTTNYQVGTVYYGDNFSFDADIYYIVSDNTIQQEPVQPGDTAGTAVGHLQLQCGHGDLQGRRRRRHLCLR